MIVKGSSIYSEPEKMKVKNTKGDLRRNEKLWLMGEIIEVSMEEATALHHEGFKVLQEGEDEGSLIIAPELDNKNEIKEGN